jgi:3-methyl-2-oxobutanoate hydroxymethyltransferase
MIHHTSAVSREPGARRGGHAVLTMQVTISEAVRNAGRLLQEGGAAAVKLEGGRPMLDVVRRLVDVGILMDTSASCRSRCTRWRLQNAGRSPRIATRSSPSRSLEEAGRRRARIVPPSSHEPSRRASAFNHRHRGRTDCDGRFREHDVLGL